MTREIINSFFVGHSIEREQHILAASGNTDALLAYCEADRVQMKSIRAGGVNVNGALMHNRCVCVYTRRTALHLAHSADVCLVRPSECNLCSAYVVALGVKAQAPIVVYIACT